MPTVKKYILSMGIASISLAPALPVLARQDSGGICS